MSKSSSIGSLQRRSSTELSVSNSHLPSHMPTLNPIIPGFNPDPTICRVGPDYFVATSTFEFFPGVPIYHSTDLVNWRLIGHALNRSSQLNMRAVPCSGGVWAPTLRYHAGRFYLTTGVMHGRGVSDVSPGDGYLTSSNHSVLSPTLLRSHR